MPSHDAGRQQGCIIRNKEQRDCDLAVMQLRFREYEYSVAEDVAIAEIVSLHGEIEALETAIRRHRDYRGDDRCYLDDRELYAVLPEGYEPPAKDTAVTLAQCERFIACRQDPATEYVSPQRRIEELEAACRLALARIESDIESDDNRVNEGNVLRAVLHRESA